MDESKLIAKPDGTYEMPEVVYMPLGYLEPGQGYRSQLRGMEELENSIRRFGILTPLLVQPHPKKSNCYIIFAGRRRYEAAKKVARERCDPSLDSSISIQLGRFLIPCRIFRDLPEVNQAIMSLTENMARRDPSTIDTAREIKRVKSLAEKQMGRQMKVEEILTVLCGPSSGKKIPGKRYVYKLLRIGELDSEVADAAKERRLSAGLLDQVTRLSKKDDQLELVGIIADLHLTEHEARQTVNKKLAVEDTPLSAIAAQVAPAAQISQGGTAADDVIAVPSAAVVLDLNAGGAVGVETKGGLVIGKPGDAFSPSVGEAEKDGETRSKAIDLAQLIERLRGQPDLELMHAADVLEAWAKGEYEHSKSGGDMLQHWLTELSDGDHDPGAVSRLQSILQREEHTRLEVELMKLLYMYQGVLPEHLPGFLRMMRESIGESPWYRRLVTHSLGLLDTLDQPAESKKVDAISRRLVDVVFHELFWLATIYDGSLRYWVEKLPQQRKTGFARYVRARHGD